MNLHDIGRFKVATQQEREDGLWEWHDERNYSAEVQPHRLFWHCYPWFTSEEETLKDARKSLLG